MGPLVVLAANAAVAVVEAPSDRISFPAAYFVAAAPPTAFDMVVRLPGFAFERGESVRGLADAGGNVLIDGQSPVSKNDSLEDILRRIPAASVASVEIIRGGASGIDMRGRPVVANIVLARRAGLQGATSVSSYFVHDGRQLPGVSAEGRYRSGESAFEISLMADRKPDDMMGSGVHSRYAGDGSLVWRSDAKGEADTRRVWTTAAVETAAGPGRVRLNGAYLLSPYEAVLVDRRRAVEFAETETTERDKSQAELGLRYTTDLAQNLAVESVLFQQWIDSDTDAELLGPQLTREFRLDRSYRESVGRVELKWQASSELDVKAGVEAAQNSLQSHSSFIQNGATVPLSAANVRVREERGEVFANASWRPRESLMLEAGLRQEASTISSQGDVRIENELDFTKPRLALTWDLASGSQIRARLERDVEQLDFDDFVASSSLVSTGAILAGNPDLRPEQRWLAEVAYERRFWGNGAAMIGISHSKLDDVVDVVPVRDAEGVAIADAPGNIGEGTLDELKLSLTLALEPLGMAAGQLKTAVTLRHSQVRDPTTGASREISNVAPVEWEVRLKQDASRWNLAWGVDVFSAFRERSYLLSEIETRRISTWVTPFLEYRPWSDVIVRVELQSATEGGVNRIREVYSGPRDNAALAYVDTRRLAWGRTLYLRVRKSFG